MQERAVTSDQPSIPDDTRLLSVVEAGSVVEVCSIEAPEEDAIRLKRMGVCAGRRIQLLQSGDPLILSVVGCRLGVSRLLASQVVVRPATLGEG